MDIRDCVKFYDEDDLSELKIKYPITVDCLLQLASHKCDALNTRDLNDLLEYVDGNGFNITYNNATKRYFVTRGKIK